MCSISSIKHRRPQRGDVVTISYTLTPENNYVPLPLFDTSGNNTKLVLHWGNYLPGLHDLISTMEVGQTVEGVSIDAGWGAKDPSLIARVPKHSKADSKKMIGDVKYEDITVGMKFVLKGNNGGNGNVNVMVTEVTEEDFVLDANLPLAGSSYECSLTLVDVEESPDMGLVSRGDVCSKDGNEAENDACAGNASDENLHCNCRSCNNDRYEVATFALGCFWGAELAFMRTPGVAATRVGYTLGGKTTTTTTSSTNAAESSNHHPTYDEVCVGNTGLAEAILVLYDPKIVSYGELVDVALERLKVDSMGQQHSIGLAALGMDDDDDEEQDWRKGQYRHGFYYRNEEQRKIATQKLMTDSEETEEEKKDDDSPTLIINKEPSSVPNPFDINSRVEIKPASMFYEAEEYHQQYLLKGGQSARKGCRETIRCFG